MKIGKDISVEFGELYLVHQNIPAKIVEQTSQSSHILFIPIQGEITITLEQANYKFGPGHMLYLPAGIIHSFESSASFGERLIAMIGPKNPILKKLGRPSPVLLPLSQLIKEILFYLLLHPKTSNSKSLVAVFTETLAELLEGRSASSNFSTDHMGGKIRDARIRKVISFIQENFSESISNEDLARTAGLSSRNLNRLMLQETGLTPKQFLISSRIEKAQELLLKPGASVTEVAFEVGYGSLSQFISAFRAQTGQLPSEVTRFGRKPKI